MVSAHALAGELGLAFGPVWSLTAKTGPRRVAQVARDPWVPVVLLKAQDVPEAPSDLILAADVGV